MFDLSREKVWKAVCNGSGKGCRKAAGNVWESDGQMCGQYLQHSCPESVAKCSGKCVEKGVGKLWEMCGKRCGKAVGKAVVNRGKMFGTNAVAAAGKIWGNVVQLLVRGWVNFLSQKK